MQSVTTGTAEATGAATMPGVVLHPGFALCFVFSVGILLHKKRNHQM